jgi:predicted ester cyclase
MEIKEIMERERWETEEFFVKGNINVFDESEVFDKDAVFHIYPFPDMKGVKAFKKFLMAALQVLTDIRWDWDEVILSGNTAVQRFTMRGKHTGTSPYIPATPTGKEVFIEGCAFYRVKNGKIVEFTEYSNYLGFYQQLGVIPPLGKKKK